MSPRATEGRVTAKGTAKPFRDRSADFEKAAAKKPRYVLRLYIAGSTSRSSRALRNVRKVCRENLGSNYQLEVIDVYQQRIDLTADQVVALPTLVKKLPLPIRKFIGDLSDTRKILVGLDIVRRKTDSEP